MGTNELEAFAEWAESVNVFPVREHYQQNKDGGAYVSEEEKMGWDELLAEWRQATDAD